MKSFVEFITETNRDDVEYPLAGPYVDGREVVEGVSNTNSISASFYQYKILQGIREVPLSEFEPVTFNSKSDNERVRELANQIESNNMIMALIVVVDSEDGPYVLEGAHRLAALQLLGANSLPALVVIDMDDTENV